MTLLEIVVAVVFVTIGVFASVKVLVRLVLESGWLNEIYIRYIRSYFVDRALRKEKEHEVDNEYYLTKLAQLQLSGRTYAERERALDYFDNVPANPRLAKKLIEILPKQRRPDIQERMAHLLSTTYTRLAEQRKANAIQGKSAPLYETRGTLQEWSIAISIWLSEIFLVILLWSNLNIFSIEHILFIGFILLLMLVVGLLFALKDWRRVGKVALIAIALFLGGLYFYSNSQHVGLGSVGIEDMTPYGIPDVGIHINYPEWLTADDVEITNKAVIFSVIGHNAVITDTLTIFFNHDRTILKIVDKDGAAKSPRLEITMANPAGEPEEFYIQPLDHNALKRAPSTRITTQIENDTVTRQDIPELEFSVKLEEPTWKTVRDLPFILSSIAGSAGLALFWFLWDRFKKS